MLTEHLPRIRLGQLPTPLHELPRLSQALGGPRLLIKRDDQTGLAAGGNKTRKLEFSLAEARRQGCDTLVTLGAVQSNHARQTAAAAALCGLRCALVLRGHAPASVSGNLLLDRLLGARVVFSGDRSLELAAADVVEEERDAGHRPCLIPLGASDEVGAAGFVAAIEELQVQLLEQRLSVDRVVFASSSGGTQAGMCVGAKTLGFEPQLAAVAIDGARHEVQACVAGIAARLARRLGVETAVAPGDVVVHDGYLGGGYAVLGDAEREAISLAARYEGLLLDPVYTGRAMAGLLDLVRQGEIGRKETILFWHTGGTPALYAYADELLATER
ncbi:MAG TPA: D-cysteine desulfhydrase family protein [Candidatus Polarisedimenticolaceae bacterium]|nr:D-cysteine desulfhydrase family protein [Candidatus Polarisedimenticolaceae bacterium]